MNWCRRHILLVYVTAMVTIAVLLELVTLLWLHNLHENGIG